MDEERVAELLSKQEIHEALLRYLRGIDRCDAELIDSAFHPDATIEHGGHRWTGTTAGREITTSVRAHHTSSDHVIGNHLIELRGETAFSETYMVCYLCGEDERGEYILVRAVRYIDQFERRGGTWKIAHRKTIRDWDRIDRITERPPRAAYFDGVRGHDDLSYRRPLVDEPVAAS